MKRIKTNLFVSVVYQFCAIVYGFILPRLILKQFGSEVNGLTQSINQFLGIISFLDMGLGQVTRSALYAPLSRQDNEQISCIMSSGGKFYRGIAKVLAGYVVALMIIYPFFVDQSFDWVFTATLIASMAVSSFAQYYFGIINEQLLHADQKSYLIYLVQIISNLVNLVGCVLMMNNGCTIHGIKLMTSVVFLSRPLFYMIYIRKHYSINHKVQYTDEPIKQKWSGIAQHVSAVVLDGTDNIVLTIFSSLSNVSIYSVYYMVVGSVQGFYQATAVAIQSAAGAAWAGADRKRIQQVFSTAELVLHVVTVFLFCCVGTLIVPFVRVYTDGLIDANYIQPVFASILVLAYGIRCLRTPYNIWILAAGHFKQTQRCHITAATLNLIISVIAVSQWGLIGVAVGTLIAMCYQTTWLTVYAARNLVKCSAGHIVKQYLYDLITVLLVCLATSWIKLGAVSYVGWLIMAIKVATITLLCIVAITMLFYRKEVLRIFRQFN